MLLTKKLIMKKILKNIFKSLIIFFCLSIFTKVSAVSIPVTEVFSDIDSDYKYINQLQALYDK
jgi:surface polysaccharide O-acyltransferase-like enzyme